MVWAGLFFGLTAAPPAWENSSVFLDQLFAFRQFQPEVYRAEHQYLYRFSGGHGHFFHGLA
jgi:hypothetical protein